MKSTTGLVPNNQPLSLSSFVGRRREIAELERLLSTTRLLTLKGAGGGAKQGWLCIVAEGEVRVMF